VLPTLLAVTLLLSSPHATKPPVDPAAVYGGRFSPAVARRVERNWPLIRAAAWAYRLDPQELAALLALETGCLPRRGGADNVHWGHGQVNWVHWQAAFAREGIADRSEQLLGPAGIWAAARVLAYWKRRAGDRSSLCRYGGSDPPDCVYARGVRWMRSRLFPS